MSSTVTRQYRLIVLILLPMAVAASVMIWSAARMLDAISSSVNNQEDERTWQAVQAGFAANMQHLGNLVSANAYSDDSYEHVTKKFDADWVASRWGSGSYEVNYDTVYVLNAKGQVKIAFHEGEIETAPPEQYFGNTYTKLMTALPRDGATFVPKSTLAWTPNGLAVVAAGPILPATIDPDDNAPAPDVLVLARSMTPRMLNSMSAQYIVDKLSISKVDAESKQHLLHDAWGTAIATANWVPRKPGDVARQGYSMTAIIAVLALLGAMVPLTFTHGLTLMRLHGNEKRALAAARTDALSGLPNRLYFAERLAAELPQSRLGGLALMFIDLDGFKAVNDTYDHATGDQLLRAVAAGLYTLMHNGETLCRLGGDEFAVLVTGEAAGTRANDLASAILAFLQEPFNIDGRIADIGASIGIVLKDDKFTDAAELMRRADLAMYDAKGGGRNRAHLYDNSMDEQRREDLAIAIELKAHIASNSIDIAYQPIVDAQTRKIRVVEALARWPTGSLHDIPPDRFVRIAEEHGLIDALGEVLMKRAFHDMKRWPGLILALNISPVQVNNRDLLNTIINTAGQENFSLERLEIELTETVLIKNAVRTKELVRELRRRGVTVALDDFGSGYASVGSLLEFDFNKVKIDRSLTRAATENMAGQKIVQGTVLIAQGLSTEIVAEGIESEEQAKLMRLAGCRSLQGFLFGRPMSADAVSILLHQAAPSSQSLDVA